MVGQKGLLRHDWPAAGQIVDAVRRVKLRFEYRRFLLAFFPFYHLDWAAES